MSSGWTRALQKDATSALSSLPVTGASSAEGDDLYFAGQQVSSAQSAQFSSWLQKLASTASASGGEFEFEAQQQLMDHLRDSLENSAALGDYTGTSLTLASFAHALNQLSAFTLLETQFRSLVDTISWDLCDLFLPTLWTEWQRACKATQIGNALQSDQLVSTAQRPITSSTLTLLFHLLEQIVLNASPREVALSLLAFYENHIQVEVELEEDDEGEEAENENDEEEFKTLAESKTKKTKKVVDTNALSPYHRMSLAFPLLDLLAKLLQRSTKQTEFYEQLLNIFNLTLTHVTSQIGEFDDQQIAPAESEAWYAMYEKLVKKCVEMIQPILTAPTTTSSTATTSPSTSSPSSSPTSSNPSRLRALAFLFEQLFRFESSLPMKHASELQMILEGNRAFISKTTERKETDPEVPSSLTTENTPVLSILFTLVSSIDRCQITPEELLQYFRTKKELEERLEQEEMKSWEKDDDDGNVIQEEEDDGDDANSKSGNAHDDEYDSQDENENAAVAAEEAKEAFLKARRPPNVLVELRKQVRALPNYHIQGVGSYLGLVLTYQYFWKIKPRRQVEAAKRTATEATITPVDQTLETFLKERPDIGREFILHCQTIDPATVLDAFAPYLSGLLFFGLSHGRLDFIFRTIGALTSLWSLLPPESIRYISDLIEKSGVWTLSETLLQCVFLCPPSWPSLRSSLIHTWKSLVVTLATSTRVRLLQLSLTACSVASIQALILGRLKEELVSAYNAPASSEQAAILSPDLLASLHANLVQAEVNVRNNIDFILALVNVFTFLVLREKSDATKSTATNDSAPPAATEEQLKSAHRLGFNSAAVRQVWCEKWTEVNGMIRTEMEVLEKELQELSAESQPEEEQQGLLQRNQLQLTSDLCQRLVSLLQA